MLHRRGDGGYKCLPGRGAPKLGQDRKTNIIIAELLSGLDSKGRTKLLEAAYEPFIKEEVVAMKASGEEALQSADPGVTLAWLLV